MGSFSDYVENKVLNHVIGKAAFTMPTAYIALSTADPLDSGGGMAEPSGNAYARVTTSGASWTTAAAGSITNAADLTFPEAAGAWGTITHFALFDAPSGGNMLGHSNLSASKIIEENDTPKFAAGDLVITLD